MIGFLWCLSWRQALHNSGSQLAILLNCAPNAPSFASCCILAICRWPICWCFRRFVCWVGVKLSSRLVVSVLRRDVGQFNELELSMEGKEKNWIMWEVNCFYCCNVLSWRIEQKLMFLHFVGTIPTNAKAFVAPLFKCDFWTQILLVHHLFVVGVG